MFIRKRKNSTGNVSFQIMEKVGRRNRLIKHLGTARNSLEENQLKELGQQFLDNQRIKSGKVSLFDSRYDKNSWEEFLSKLEFISALDTPTFDFFKYFYHLIGLNSLNDSCFCDLVIARIIWPLSKAKTKDFLESNLNKNYSLTSLYRTMQTAILKDYQGKIEAILWDFLQRRGETVSVLFFDVTTLYFEAFDEDEFRKCGFSKDHKSNQPQVTVTLTVTPTGFPLHLRSFSGNKFEGHTIIPCILDICKRYNLNDLIVVADSAMVSQTNMEELENHNLRFIVGARLGNFSKTIFQQIVTIPKTDGATQRFNLGNNKALVVAYSQKRAVKDKSDREKQLRRANYALANPSAVARNFKFLEKTKFGDFSLNKNLLQKSEQLEGLKGYITNAIYLTDQEIIFKYSQLWQVEKSFRISKSDLKARPIFHTAKEKIEAHLLIVFTALAIIRLAENTTKLSVAKILEKLNPVKQIIIEDKLTKEQTSKFIEPNDESKSLLKLAKINWVT